MMNPILRNMVLCVLALSYGAYALSRGNAEVAACALALCSALWMRSGRAGDAGGRWTVWINLALSAATLAYGAYAVHRGNTQIALAAAGILSALWAHSGLPPQGEEGPGPGDAGAVLPMS